ncbi:response regulator transcription factor [Streptomyces sp. NPDC048603]|uniref:response regulator transcription factor n=1 Tax=Streptomyces sp. NPDC048603 TaxID=3365577 RepID=UPI00371145C8
MRLLLVEDDDHVAAALSAILARHGFQVTHARSGEEALQALLPAGAPPTVSPYGVILLDLGLPDQDGYEVCGKIRKRTSTPVIMVTARGDVRSRIHGLNMGADDYVVKPYDTGELLARIHAVARRTSSPGGNGGNSTGSEDSTGPGVTGHPGGPSGTVRLGPVSIELPTRRVSVNGTDVPLTRKEFDLLALLAQRPGVVFRREQIISEVWRTSWEGTGRTLEVHVASLRSKLRMPALIETVRGVGYRLVAPGPSAPGPGAR